MTAARDVRRETWSAHGDVARNLRIFIAFSEVTASAAHMGSTLTASVPKAASFKRQRVSGGGCRLYLPLSVCTSKCSAKP